MVSHVDTLEEIDGTKLLEIPAGDYEPKTIPSVIPEFPVIVYGQQRNRQSDDLLSQSLIDDIEEKEEISDQDYLNEHNKNNSINEFIDNEIKETLAEDSSYDNLEKVLANGFPSANNWQSLANDLANIIPETVSKKAYTSTTIERIETFVENFKVENDQTKIDE